MEPQNFHAIVVRAATKAKLPPGVTPYVLRHSYGTRLTDNGVDPFEIARLMGHSTLEQSMDYVHRSDAARQRILAALGDESTKRLRLVGDDQARGMERGMDPRPTGSDHDRSGIEVKGG
ncbi:tyrosine-type recombinase/integrase [Saccharopolyspora sp. NPDC002686]|uniref:tyrosine-type recombinase/integrase n=1 Tax=Saccharopolyspora sp. NPDC002686 TaxID=3154541 RepID=UPI00332F6C40